MTPESCPPGRRWRYLGARLGRSRRPPAHAVQAETALGVEAATVVGFVAILGVISLIGMVIRNSVILIDQIETEITGGRHPWDAVIVATQHRLRPILLTAAAAILGMVPISPTVFWGPMAYAVIGGLVVATLLTLVFCRRSTSRGFASSPRRA